MGLLNGSVICTVIFLISTVKAFGGGYDALQNEFPYHAFIDVYDSENSNIGSCSGAVINSKFILTTLACVSFGEKFRVTLGLLNPFIIKDAAYDHLTCKTPHFPPPFRAEERYIALIELEVPITLKTWSFKNGNRSHSKLLYRHLKKCINIFTVCTRL